MNEQTHDPTNLNMTKQEHSKRLNKFIKDHQFGGKNKTKRSVSHTGRVITKTGKQNINTEALINNLEQQKIVKINVLIVTVPLFKKSDKGQPKNSIKALQCSGFEERLRKKIRKKIPGNVR